MRIATFFGLYFIAMAIGLPESAAAKAIKDIPLLLILWFILMDTFK